MEKNIFSPTILYVFIMFVITKFGENFEELISTSFEMFWTRKAKSKSLTNSQDFCPDPPDNEKLKSSVFWMNYTILIIFINFMGKKEKKSEKSYGNQVEPPPPP